MTPERWERIKELFEAVLEREPPLRAEFLENACHGDETLRKEVERLVDRHDSFPPAEPAGAARTFREGELIAGRYRIARFLGEGGMGEVYEAEDRELGGRVALKAIRPEIASDERMVARFKSEIQLARQVTHPNVCRIFDVARHQTESGSVAFLTMEYLPGETLAQKITAHGPLPAAEALPLMRQMADALDAAHRAGVIHRDFKTSNVILTPADKGVRAVVTDFGLARSADLERARTLTITGNIIGSPDYMAPELFAGEPATIASDVYSLGVVLLEMLTGRRSTSAARGDLKIDARWEQAIAKCMEREPARRFASAGAVVRAMEGGPSRIRIPAKWVWATISVLLITFGWLGLRDWRSGARSISPEALRWYRTGTEFAQAGASFAATRALEQAVKVDSRYSMAHARLADAWNDLGAGEKAKQEMLLAQGPGESLSLLPEIDRLYVEAVYSTITRRFKEAEEKYEEMLRKTDGAGKPVIYFDLGRVFERESQFEKAIDNYRRAETATPGNPAASLRLAILYTFRQKPAEAREEFRKSDTFYEALSNQEGITEVLLQRGVAANRANRAQEAGDLLRQALAGAQVTKDVYQIVVAKLQLGVLAINSNRAAEAQEYVNQAIATARENGMELFAVQGLVSLAGAMQSRHDFAAAETYLQDALNISRRENSRRWEAISLIQLAALHVPLKRFDEGVKEARQALSIFREDHFSTETGFCLTLIGRAQRDRGDYPAASGTFGELVALGEKSGDRAQIALGQESLGSLLVRQERLPEALSRYRRSLELSTALGDKSRIASGSQQCGDVLWRLGRYDESRDMLSRASAAAGDNLGRKLDIETSQAEIALSQLHYADAASQCRSALATVGAKDVPRLTDLRRILGMADIGLGNRREGLKLCDDAFQTAAPLGDASLVSRATLSIMEAQIETSDYQGAVKNYRDAEEPLSHLPETGWRSALLAARASEKTSDRSQTRQLTLLGQTRWKALEALWEAEPFRHYSARPDIQQSRRHLSRLLAAFDR
ncbi:MAG: tetratricopeptide repeat protein [Acidobacteriota bacterium]|nr:tetratricopeptide repeat protein [Acidobacteriota bacterium]